jgi:hypothetical protein
LFRKRKGKQRLKQRESRKVRSIETSIELDYSNHLEEEKSYDTSEKIYKKNHLDILRSSFLQFTEDLQTLQYFIQILLFTNYYNNSKKIKREANEFSSIQQGNASSDRHNKEAYVLLEAEEERNRYIN